MNAVKWTVQSCSIRWRRIIGHTTVTQNENDSANAILSETLNWDFDLWVWMNVRSTRKCARSHVIWCDEWRSSDWHTQLRPLRCTGDCFHEVCWDFRPIGFIQKSFVSYLTIVKLIYLSHHWPLKTIYLSALEMVDLAIKDRLSSKNIWLI